MLLSPIPTNVVPLPGVWISELPPSVGATPLPSVGMLADVVVPNVDALMVEEEMPLVRSTWLVVVGVTELKMLEMLEMLLVRLTWLLLVEVAELNKLEMLLVRLARLLVVGVAELTRLELNTVLLWGELEVRGALLDGCAVLDIIWDAVLLKELLELDELTANDSESVISKVADASTSSLTSAEARERAERPNLTYKPYFSKDESRLYGQHTPGMTCAVNVASKLPFPPVESCKSRSGVK